MGTKSVTYEGQKRELAINIIYLTLYKYYILTDFLDQSPEAIYRAFEVLVRSPALNQALRSPAR